MRAAADPAAMPELNPTALAIAGVALVVAAVAGYWGYGAYSKSQTRKVAAALVKDTSQRLRDALLAEAAGPSTTAADAVARLEAQVAAVEGNYTSLRRLDAAVLGALADAADDYVLTSQEILRRIAGQVDPSVPIESEVIASVRAGTLQATKRIAMEVEKLTNLAAYR